MSFDPFGHSPDLAALAAEGLELEITAGGHLLVKHVPYRTHDGQVGWGVVVTKLELDGDVTVIPVKDHTVRFIGSAPCDSSGTPVRAVTGTADEEIEPGLVVNHQMSYKPEEPYPDFCEKVKAYVAMIAAEAQALDALDATIDARNFGPCIVDDEGWPFEYVDTASGRAGTGAISGRLFGQRIAIVGVGGTGSYILDLVAKCPVDEIHLFDTDRFSTHNAFRAPGAPSLDELRAGQFKVEYLAKVYAKMKRNIVAHPYEVEPGNVEELRGMSFVFLAMEGGDAKRNVIAALETMGMPFVDCNLGVVKSNDVLLASVEINASTPANRTMVHEKVDFGAMGDDDPYAENIQIAELNALDAVLAVLWWKKHLGLYHSPTDYHHQQLNIGFNQLISE